MKKGIFYLFMLFLIFSSSSLLLAQRQTGSIRGTVTDEESNPLPGVSVTISSPSMQGTLSYITTAKGDYRFPVCPPGEYAVRAELKGFQTIEKTGVIVRVEMTVDVNIQTKLSSVQEELTVVAVSPVIDTESHGAVVTVTKDLIANIPMRRDVLDIFRSAPGTVGEDSSQDYRKSASVHGGSLSDSKISIDGVDLVDPQRGYVSADVAFDAIEEVNIGLSGHKAEVGQISGGYVNVVSKSGGNKLSGGITIVANNKSLTQNIIPDAQLKATGLRTPIFYKYKFDAGMSIGGPILKDRLWFFFSPRYTDRNKETMFIPFTDPEGVYHGPYDYRRREYAALSKLTAQISKSLKWTGMYQYTLFKDHPSAWGSTRPFSPWEMSHEWNDDSHTVSQVLTLILNQNTYFETRMGYVDRYMNCESHDPEGPKLRIGGNERTTGYLWGDAFGEEIYRRKMLTVGFTITKFQDDFLGLNHEFKGGAEYSRGTAASQRTFPQPYTNYWWKGQPWGYMDQAPYKGRIDINSPQMERDAMPRKHGFWRVSAFFQDSMTLKNRLTLNLGIRYDESHGYQPEAFYKGWVDPYFNGLANILVPSIFVDHDMTFPAMNDLIVYRRFSPRIGVTYDLFGNGKTSLKSSFSRYSEILLAWNVEGFHPFKSQTISITWYDENKNATYDLPPIDRYEVGSYTNFITDPEKLKQQVDQNLSCPYQDEWAFGISQEIFKNFSLSMNFLYKNSRNLAGANNLVNPRDGSMWIPYTAKDPGADKKFQTGDDQDLTVYMLRQDAQPDFIQRQNISEAKRKYWGMDLILFKRMSNNWQMSGSLTYSKSYGNYDNAYGAVSGGANWWNPNGLINNWGRTTFDRPIILKLMSTVVLPYEISVSGYYRFVSGSAWARTATVYFPTTLDGIKPKSPSVTVRTEPVGTRRNIPESVMDLRIEKDFRIGPGRLGLWLEVFNLFGYYAFSIDQNPGGYIYADGRFVQFPNYGKVTSAEGARSVNLSFKFTF